MAYIYEISGLRAKAAQATAEGGKLGEVTTILTETFPLM